MTDHDEAAEVVSTYEDDIARIRERIYSRPLAFSIVVASATFDSDRFNALLQELLNAKPEQLAQSARELQDYMADKIDEYAFQAADDMQWGERCRVMEVPRKSA